MAEWGNRKPVPVGKGEDGVLIIEDEMLVALYLEDTLDTLGYRCCGIAGTPQQALEAVKSHVPAVAIVDIGLGGKQDGISLACELTERFGIAVIFMSGASDAVTRERALRARPFAFLPKPCSESDIAQTLEAAFRPPPS